MDILPTILDAVGLPPAADLPGRSLLPGAERSATAPVRTSYFEAMGAMLNRGWAPLSGVLAGPDKFIDLPIPERYDLAADAGEGVNLAGRAPNAIGPSPRPFAPSTHRRPATAAPRIPDAAARLRALGLCRRKRAAEGALYRADDPKRSSIRSGGMTPSRRSASRFDEAVRIIRASSRNVPTWRRHRHLAFVEWQRGNPGGVVLQRALRG